MLFADENRREVEMIMEAISKLMNHFVPKKAFTSKIMREDTKNGSRKSGNTTSYSLAKFPDEESGHRLGAPCAQQGPIWTADQNMEKRKISRSDSDLTTRKYERLQSYIQQPKYNMEPVMLKPNGWVMQDTSMMRANESLPIESGVRDMYCGAIKRSRMSRRDSPFAFPIAEQFARMYQHRNSENMKEQLFSEREKVFGSSEEPEARGPKIGCSHNFGIEALSEQKAWVTFQDICRRRANEKEMRDSEREIRDMYCEAITIGRRPRRDTPFEFPGAEEVNKLYQLRQSAKIKEQSACKNNEMFRNEMLIQGSEFVQDYSHHVSIKPISQQRKVRATPRDTYLPQASESLVSEKEIRDLYFSSLKIGRRPRRDSPFEFPIAEQFIRNYESIQSRKIKEESQYDLEKILRSSKEEVIHGCELVKNHSHGIKPKMQQRRNPQESSLLPTNDHFTSGKEMYCDAIKTGRRPRRDSPFEFPIAEKFIKNYNH